ncbi:hypothetical protein TD95_005243 [Thielaviopsis punctulata]|uniref:Enoyl reductase (ER) domain-containing protein n=1 Tax=Thielaviopsis punctulata TaxID=72032 RepID=A0A0F4ZCQ9_9PEZI|nr:hypothetical protein TD95_005243 [Thielaviopsis punctulata]
MVLPTANKAAVIQDQGPSFSLTIASVPLPPLPPSSVLVRMIASGLCGTDLSICLGAFGPTQPTPGHEGIGRIISIGSAVNAHECPPNTLVGIGFIRDACSFCTGCRRDETRCTLRAMAGVNIPGCLAEYAIVPARYVTRVPDSVPPEILAPVMCAGVTAYKALRVAGLRAGHTVVLTGGGGGLGQMGVQYAKAMGVRVVVVDAGPEKGAAVLRLGAEAYVDFLKEDVVERVRELTGGEMAAAVLVMAGNIPAYNQAMDLVGMYGTVVCVGICKPGDKMGVDPKLMIDNGIRILGSMVGGRQDIKEAMDFVKQGRVKPAVRVVGVSDINSVMQEMKAGTLTEKVVVELDFE